MNSPTLILILLAVAVVSAIVSRAYFLRRIYRKLNYMLDALEDKETNFHFTVLMEVRWCSHSALI